MSNNPQCFHNEADDVFKGGNGRILTAGVVILCKGCPFIVLEDGIIDGYTMGKNEPGLLYYGWIIGCTEGETRWAAGREEHKVVTRLWQTVSDRQRQTHRNQIAGIDTLVTTNDNSKTTNNTGSPITLEGLYNQGKGVTDHIPNQVNNLQMNNTHIGTQVPTYVINNGTPHDNTSQDPFKATQPCNDPCSDKQFQVIAQGGNKPQSGWHKVVQVVKTCQQVLGDLNEFMVTEFRTLFTNKCIDLTGTVIPLVREFNQVCQVFADSINIRWNRQYQKEVEIWAKKFNIPITEALVDSNHRHPPKMDSWGVTEQQAGLLPPQQPQAQPQAEYFSWQPEMVTNRKTKKSVPGIQLWVGQVGACGFQNGNTIDPAREKINWLWNVANKWKQQQEWKRRNGKYSDYVEATLSWEDNKRNNVNTQ